MNDPNPTERVLRALGEANDRASAAEAEVSKLTRERDEALCLAEGPSTLLDLARGSVGRGFELHEAQATVSALRDRVAVLEEVLKRAQASEPSECPFDLSPKVYNKIAPDQPCPICGDLGTFDAENMNRQSKCVSPNYARTALTQGGENAEA
jgi:hypothetical protein